MDINDTMLSEMAPPEVPENDFVNAVRLGQFSENTVRVVFDLKNDINYQVFQDNNVFSVIFSEGHTVEDCLLYTSGWQYYKQ